MLGVGGEGPAGVGQVVRVGVGDGHGDPECGQGLEGLVVEEATDWPRSGTDAVPPSRVEIRSWWSTKSKSMAKPARVPAWSMGRVVMPRPVRWKGTFHQWLRRTLAARRSFPTT